MKTRLVACAALTWQCLFVSALPADQAADDTTTPVIATDADSSSAENRSDTPAAETVPDDRTGKLNQPFVIEDRFETELSAQYKTAGNVTWSPGQVNLSENSGFSRQAVSGPQFQIEFDIDPQLNDAGVSVTHLNLPMSNGFKVLVMVARMKSADGYQTQIQIGFTRSTDDDDEAPKVNRTGVGKLQLKEGETERWVLQFEYGVAKISVNGQPLGSNFVETDGVWCAGVILTTQQGSLAVKRLKFVGRDPTYSPEQQAIYQQTTVIKQRERDFSLNEFDEIRKLKQETIRLMRKAFGDNYYGIGLEYDAIGQDLLALDRFDEAIVQFATANRVLSESLGEHHPRATMTRIRIGECFVNKDQLVRGMNLILPNVISHLRVAGPNGDPSRLAIVTAANALIAYDRKMSDAGRYQEAYQAAVQYNHLFRLRFGDDTDRYYWHDQRLQLLRALVASRGDERETLATIETKLRADLNRSGVVNQQIELKELLELRQLCSEQLGDQHPYTLDTRIKANVIRTNIGDFGVAIQDFESLAGTLQATVGDQHPLYAIALCDLASSYSIHQRHEKATPLFDQGIEILTDAQGLWGQNLAKALLERGRHQQRMGNIYRAEKDLHAAYECLIETGSETGGTAITILDRLIDIQRTRVNLPKARALLKQQRDLVVKQYGKESGEYYSVLFSEAIEAAWNRSPKIAKEKYVAARQRALEFYGPHSRAYRSVVESELDFLIREGEFDLAGERLKDLVEFQRNRREMLFDVYSTSEQFDQSLLDHGPQNRVMALASQGRLNPAAAYQMVLATKGAVADYQRRQAFARRDPVLKKDLDRLQVISRAISNVGSLQVALRRESDQRYSEERLEIQRRIAAHYRKSANATDQVTPAVICEHVLPGTVVIDYVEFFAGDLSSTKFLDDSQRQMAAFVFSSDREVELVHLGRSVIIERAVEQWATAIGQETAERKDADGRTPQQVVDEAGIKLRKLILDPVLAGHPAPKALVIAPAGILTCCPFDALPLRRDGTLLIERLPVSYTLAAQLLAGVGVHRDRPDNASALIVGDIEYGESGHPSGNPFSQLPDVDARLVPIRETFEQHLGADRVSDLLGEEATELAFSKAAPGRQYVHIHTHGFYTDTNSLGESDGRGESKMVSGIALAGANSLIMRTSEIGGILYDNEIAAMDWTSADLVMLSACQSAMGDWRLGEGLQGLHRALAVSGAASSISTLWIVENSITLELARRIYEGLLTDGLSKVEALRQAKIHLIREYQWDGGRRRERERCPITLWAPFVLYGDQ